MKSKHLALVIVSALISWTSFAQQDNGAPQNPPGNQPAAAGTQPPSAPKAPKQSHRKQPGKPTANKNAATEKKADGSYPDPDHKNPDAVAKQKDGGKYPDPTWQTGKGADQAAKANEKMSAAKDKIKNKMDEHADEAKKALENAQNQNSH